MPYPDPDDSADLSDREFPDDSDDADDADDSDDPDDPETVPCPHCRNLIAEDAEICPHCKSYLSDEDAPRRYPWWLIAGVVLCVLLALLWVL